MAASANEETRARETESGLLVLQERSCAFALGMSRRESLLLITRGIAGVARGEPTSSNLPSFSFFSTHRPLSSRSQIRRLIIRRVARFGKRSCSRCSLSRSDASSRLVPWTRRNATRHDASPPRSGFIIHLAAD